MRIQFAERVSGVSLEELSRRAAINGVPVILATDIKTHRPGVTISLNGQPMRIVRMASKPEALEIYRKMGFSEASMASIGPYFVEVEGD